MQQALLFFLLLFAAAVSRGYELPVSTSGHVLNFSAREIRYSDSGKTMRLKGDVTLEEVFDGSGTVRTVRADRLDININSRTAVSPGRILVKQGGAVIVGDRGSFDYTKGEGVINNGRLKAGGVIFRGKTVNLSERKFSYKKASLTTCDFFPPHYRITSSFINLRFGKSFSAFNNIMHIGKVPVFYFPFIYKPLGEGTPVVSSFHPGYDDKKGFYLKSDFMYRFGDFSRGKLYLDYFSRKGFGTGGEYTYHDKRKNMTNVSFYRIREYGSETDRQGSSGGFWHRFSSDGGVNYYGQSFFRWLSEPDFNNDYFRDNPFAVSADKEAKAALTRQTPKTVLRASANSKYARSATGNVFEKSYESAPRIEYSASSVKFGVLPFVHNFNLDFESSKETGESYYQRKGNASWNITTNASLGNFTLYPSLAWNETVRLSTAAGVSDSWRGKWRSNLVLRYGELWGNVDFKYSYAERLAKNKIKKDIRSADAGEEENSLGMEVFVRPAYNAYFKVSGEYDLKEGGGESFIKRLSNVEGEFYYSAGPGMDFFAQSVYSLSRGNQSFIAQGTLRNNGDYLSLGLVNYKSGKDDFLVSNKFGFKGGKTWKLEGVFRYKIKSEKGLEVNGLEFFEKSLVLHKEFHDFNTSWKFSSRKGVGEFSFFVNLKWNASARKDEADEYWNPWRKEGNLRD